MKTYKTNCKALRLQAYKYALECYENKLADFGICVILAHFLRGKAQDVYNKIMRSCKPSAKHYPELLEHKPKNKNIEVFWWRINDKEIRIKVLREIITKMENK